MSKFSEEHFEDTVSGIISFSFKFEYLKLFEKTREKGFLTSILVPCKQLLHIQA